MRWILTLGIAIAAVGVVGCNNGSKSGTRKSAGTSSVNSSTTGTGTGTSADAPKVTSVSPAAGPVDGGTAVIISGTNFTKSGAGQTLVLFGTRAVVVTPVSDTEIRVTSPLQLSAGAVDVRVINELGVGSMPASFTYDPRTPGMSYFPLVGCADPAGQGGTKITLDLVGFAPVTSNTTVDFGATRATTVVIVDQDTLVAQVPTGLVPGVTPITVTEGTRTISSPGFRVQGTLVYGDLVFNEVLTGPGGRDTNGDGVASSTADEFLEIVNTTTNPIDLTYILLRDNAATTAGTINHRFPNPTTIPAGGSIVVFATGMPEGFPARNQNGSAQVAVNTGGTGLGLTSGETVVIEDQHLDASFNSTIIFKVTLPAETAGTSFTLRNEGQRITTNPATGADYELHPARTTTQGSFNFSPGTKRDGTSF